MKSILLTLILCSSIVAQDPPASKIELSIEKDKYEIKDNIFINVKNADEKIRVKIISPSLEVLPPIKLHEEGGYFFQAVDAGKYFIEASDADDDAFQVVEVLSNLPIDNSPKSITGKDIFEELLKVDYANIGKDCDAIADIFEKNIGKEPAQKLINDTFTEIQAYLKDNPDKEEWKIFFVFLQAYYEGLRLKSSDMEAHNQLWKDTKEAFICRSKK
jgi:hypothetical protein